jgi:hypothetical protein
MPHKEGEENGVVGSLLWHGGGVLGRWLASSDEGQGLGHASMHGPKAGGGLQG